MSFINKYYKHTALVLFSLVSLFVVFNPNNMDLEKNPPSYDENNWVSVSISAYNMLFNGYAADTILEDSWFTVIAQKHKLDIFKPSTDPNIRIIDYAKISRDQYKWFDKRYWTFGWKAPNFTKVFRGMYLYLRLDDDKIEPGGYNRPGIREKNEDPKIYVGDPPLEFVKIGREFDAFFCFLTLIAVVLIGWRFISFPVGLVAGIYLLLNQNFIDVCTDVGMDSCAFFFSLVSLGLMAEGIRQFYNEASLKSMLPTAILLGLSMGFGVSSKLNAALVFYIGIPVAILLLITLLLRLAKKIDAKNDTVKKNASKKKGSKSNKIKATEKPAQTNLLKNNLVKALIVGIIVGGTSIGIFLLLNPYMYGDTAKKVEIIQESVHRFFEKRANNLKTRDIMDNWAVSFELVLNRNYIVEDSQQYYGTLGNLIPNSGNPLDLILLLIGFGITLILAIRDIFNAKITFFGILIIGYLIFFYHNVHFIWIDYSRYHLPFYICGVFIIAIGLVYPVQYGFQKLRQKTRE